MVGMLGRRKFQTNLFSPFLTLNTGSSFKLLLVEGTSTDLLLKERITFPWAIFHLHCKQLGAVFWKMVIYYRASGWIG